MKRRNLLFPLLITAMGWGSCAKNDPGNVGNGSLVVRLDVDPTVRVVAASATKSADAATFTLEILQNETVIKKLSPIGVDPGPIELPSGVYTVRTYSQSFTAPAFDTPVYGGSAGVSIAVDNETRFRSAASRPMPASGSVIRKLFAPTIRRVQRRSGRSRAL